MSIFGRTVQPETTEPETTEAELTDDQAPEPDPVTEDDVQVPIEAADTPLSDHAASEEIAAARDQHHQRGTDLEELADREQAMAGEIRAALQEEIARITAEAQAEAAPHDALAAAASKVAGAEVECALRLGNAARIASDYEAKKAIVQALEDERDELEQRRVALSGRLAEHAAQQLELEPQLAAAIEDADLALVTKLRGDLDGIRAMEEAVRGQLAPVTARLAEIGDGEMSPLWPQKELAEARRRRGAPGGELPRALNFALPDRPEAAVDRAREHERLIAQVGQEREAERRRQEQQQRPRTVVL